MNGSLRKRNNKWSYSFELGIVDGKRKRKEKGGFRTKAEAQQALRKAIIEYENNGQVFEPSEITVSDYLDFWLDAHSINIKFNSIKLYTKYIEKHIKPVIGNYKLKSVTPAILQELINNLFNNGYSKSTVSSILAIITNSFKKAVYPYQYIKDNPAQYITLPKYEPQKSSISDKVISNEDFKRIIEKYKNSDYFIPLILAYYTGFRVGECLGLTWENIDFKQNTITVKTNLINRTNGKWELGTPKTATSNRTIIVSQKLMDILKEHRKKQLENRLFYCDYYTNLFIDKNNIIHKSNGENFKPIEMVCTRENGDFILLTAINWLSIAIKRDLGINFSFHALRHTHATRLAEAGANMKDIQHRLGHSNFATTSNTYSHVTENMEKETVKLFDEAAAKI